MHRLLALIVTVVTAAVLAAPAAASDPPVCNKSGKEIGNGRAPGLLKAAQHSRSVHVCIVTFPGDGTPV